MKDNYIKTASDLGQRIKEKRKKLKINQAELAGISNVGIRFISDLENGKPTIEFNKALQVAGNIGLKLIIEE